MARDIPASSFRPLLELAASRGIRRKIMETEARRENAFTLRQAQIASVPALSLDRLGSKLGPITGAETFYILGSGASIEDLTSSHFEHIARQASVGINNWGVHPFVPDMYSFESVTWVGDGQDFPRAMGLLDRSDIRSRQPQILILRPKTTAEIENINILPELLRSSVSFYGRVTPATRKSRNLAGDVEEFFTQISPHYPSVVMDSGASVVRMVVLGILLGFRRIVLAGVDLNGSPYFWEKNPEYLSSLSGGAPVNNQVRGTHETASPANRPFDVTTMLRALDIFFQTQRGGELLVTSPHSALAEFLPLETWGSV